MYLKKLLLIGFVVLAFALPVAAQPAADISIAGTVFPADTDVLFAASIDDGLIETLDTLAVLLRDTVPDADIPPGDTPVSDVLNLGTGSVFGDSFDDAVRPWLGDIAAVGVMDFSALAENDFAFEDGEIPFLAAVEILDAAAAEEAFRTLAADALEFGEMTEITVADVTYYQIADGDPPVGYVFTADTFYAGTPDVVLEALDGFESLLSDTTSYQETIATLPRNDYGMLAYVNYAGLTEEFLVAAFESDPELANNPFMQGYLEQSMAALELIDGIAMGAGLINGTTLTIDIATAVNEDAYLDAGYIFSDLAPLNFDFASRISADAAFVIHSSDIAGQYENATDNFAAGIALQYPDNLEGLTSASDVAIEFGEFMGALFDFGLAQSLGLDTQDDLLSWLVADVAFVFGVQEGVADAQTFSDLLREFPAEWGFLADASADPDAAGRVVTALGDTIETLLMLLPPEASEEVQIALSDETIAGGDVVVLTITSSELPFPVEFMVGSNDAAFALGTRGVVTTALTGDGGFPTTVGFTDAADAILPGSQTLMVVNGDALDSLQNALEIAGAFDRDMEDLAFALDIALDLVTSATISGSEEGTLARATITLRGE